jgi:hypothetical protein
MLQAMMIKHPLEKILNQSSPFADKRRAPDEWYNLVWQSLNFWSDLCDP